jgi:hypothetical protein
MEGKGGLAVGMEVCITSTLGIRHRFSIHHILQSLHLPFFAMSLATTLLNRLVVSEVKTH